MRDLQNPRAPSTRICEQGIAPNDCPAAVSFVEEFEDMTAEVASSFDWVRVWEIFLAAALAFVFGAILQWRLMVRQEKFQEKMEARRDAQEEKAEQRRLDAERRNTAAQVAAQKQIAMDNRNFEARERSRDRIKFR